MPLLLPEHLRRKLKEPLGVLIRGRRGQTTRRLKIFLADRHIETVTTIGDVVTEEFIAAIYPPKLSIVDFKSLRRPHSFQHDPTVYFNLWMNVRNPPATITEELLHAIRSAYSMDGRTLIIVDGEEDLAALPAVIEAPIGSAVVYGQPGEGIVVIVVDEEAKSVALKLINMFEKV